MVDIRRAGSGDIDEITRLWVHLQADNAMLDSRLLASGEAMNRFRDYAAGVLETKHTACFLATESGKVIGFTLGQIHQRPTLALGDCGYITDLYVDPDHRLRGLGRALYHALRDWYHSRGIISIEVQIVRASSGSQAFWRKMGFSDFLRTLRNDGSA